MLGQYVLNEHGEPRRETDLVKWGEWLRSGKKHVGDTPVGDGRVSTIFLGIDHGWGGRSLWFETMIFGVPGIEDWQERYETHAEAVAGHAVAVELARAAIAKAEGERA